MLDQIIHIPNTWNEKKEKTYSSSFRKANPHLIELKGYNLSSLLLKGKHSDLCFRPIAFGTPLCIFHSNFSLLLQSIRAAIVWTFDLSLNTVSQI